MAKMFLTQMQSPAVSVTSSRLTFRDELGSCSYCKGRDTFLSVSLFFDRVVGQNTNRVN